MVWLSKNYEFFMNTDLSDFVGQWIAVVDEKIVASGSDFSVVFRQVKSKFPSKIPFVAMAPCKAPALY